MAFPATIRAQRHAPPPLSLFPTTTLWTLALNAPLAAPPARDDTRVYFPIEGGRIAAYRLDTGTQDWTASARPLMEPVAGDGLLFIIEPDLLTALGAADGAIAWQLPFAEKLAVRPVWDNGWLVASTSAGTVFAFRASDGFLVWRRDLGSPAHGVPALAADRVYIPTDDGRVVALRVDTGAPVWERRLGGAPNDILALDDRVYVGSKDKFFYCLDTKEGRIRWRWRTGGDVIGLPVVDEDNVYFVSLDNVLRALARKSGSQQWLRALPLRPTSGPLRAGGAIVVAGLAPTLRGYNAADGTPAGDIATMGELAAPPLLVPGPAFPRLLVLVRDIATGAAALLFTRAVEPAPAPVAPLPNVVSMAPAPTSTTIEEQ